MKRLAIILAFFMVGCTSSSRVLNEGMPADMVEGLKGVSNAIPPPADSVADKVVFEAIGDRIYVETKWQRKQESTVGEDTLLAYDVSSKGSKIEWWVDVINPKKIPLAYRIALKWKATNTTAYEEPAVDVALDPGEKKRIRGGRTFKTPIGDMHMKSISINPAFELPVDGFSRGPSLVDLQVDKTTDKEVFYTWKTPVAVTALTLKVKCDGVETATLKLDPKKAIVTATFCDWEGNEIGKSSAVVENVRAGEVYMAVGKVSLPKDKVLRVAGNWMFKVKYEAK